MHIQKPDRGYFYSSSFTLVEILVVVSIIGLLAGLAFPAIQGALNSAKKGKAKAEMQSIVTAVKAYQNEYGRLPIPNNATSDDDAYFSHEASGSPQVFRVLAGSNEPTGMNPREIVFLELPARSTNGVFTDPWAKPGATTNNYVLKFDADGDNRVNYSGTNYNVVVTVISFGKDGIQNTPDDVFSFK